MCSPPLSLLPFRNFFILQVFPPTRHYDYWRQDQSGRGEQQVRFGIKEEGVDSIHEWEIGMRVPWMNTVSLTIPLKWKSALHKGGGDKEYQEEEEEEGEDIQIMLERMSL